MATLNPTISNVHIRDAGAVDGAWEAEIFWTVTGTYDQAATESIEITGVPAAIQNAMRNGKTVTLTDVCRGQRATKVSDPSAFMSTAAVAINGTPTIVDCTITDGDETTELANGAVPAQDRPFSTIVKFTAA